MSTSNQYIVYNIECTENSTSIANNTSNVRVLVDCWRTNTGYTTYGTGTIYCRINGTLYSDTITTDQRITHDGVYLFDKTLDIPHNSDGTKTLTISAWIEHSVFSSSEQSWSTQLTTIPRYANLTSLTVKSRTVNSITLSYTTDKNAWLFAKVNDGEWLNNGDPFKSNTTSGEFTIYYKNRASTQRLDVNTSYKIEVLCRSIDRESGIDTSKTITTSTYDIAKITEAPNVNIGSSHTIKWTNPSGATTSLKLCKTDGTTLVYNVGTVTGTSKSVTPTASTIYALIPNSNSIVLRYIITTTANSTSYTNYKDCTFNVANSNPTFSNFTYKDSNSTTSALTGDNQVLIKGQSTLQVTISSANKMVAQNSATAKNYVVSCDTRTSTVNYSSNADVNANLGTIVNSGTKRLNVTAYDSRNNSKNVYKDITVYDYAVPVLNVIAQRLNNFENQTTIKISGTYSRLTIGNTDKNTITKVQYRYRESNGTWGSWIELTTTINAGTYLVSDIILSLDNTKSYEFQVQAIDRLNTTTVTRTVSEGKAVFFISKNGGISVNDNYDSNVGGAIQANGIIHATGGLKTNGKTSQSDGKAGAEVGAGNIELYHATPFIDFHFNNSTADYTSRIVEIASGTLRVSNNFGIGGDLTVDGIANKIFQHHGNAPSNLDNAITHGSYRIGGTYTNAPLSSNIYGILLVYESFGGTWEPANQASWCWQILILTVGNIYMRRGVNSATMTEWTQLV